MFGGEGARAGHRLGEGDQRERRGVGQQVGHVRDAEARKDEMGQTVGDLADDGDAVVHEAEDGHRDDPEHDGNQRRRHLGREGPQREEHGQGRDPDGQRRQVGGIELAQQHLEFAEEAGAAALHAEQLGQLPHADDERQSGDEAGQHRTREEVGDEAGAGEAGGQKQHADEKGEQRRQGDETAGVAGRQRRHRGRRVRRDGRTRTDRELPAGAEDGVCQQRQQGGEEAGLGGHAGQRGIGHALRHEHGPDRRRRDQIGPQPASLVMRQPLADGERRGFDLRLVPDPLLHALPFVLGPR